MNSIKDYSNNLSPLGVAFAEPSQRLVAYMIDGILTTVLCMGPLLFIRNETMFYIWGIFIILWIVGYYGFVPSLSGQTIGKMVMGIKVISRDGRTPSIMHNLLRNWLGYGLCLLTFYIGFIMIVLTENKQGLHDMIFGTYVVRA